MSASPGTGIGGPRPLLVALGPIIGASTVVAALSRAGAPGVAVVPLAILAAVLLTLAGHRGGDVALTGGLGIVAVAAGATVVGDGSGAEIVLWTAGAVAAGEATGLARRTRSTAVPDGEAVAAELTTAGVVVGATLVGGVVLLGAGELPGPDGLLGEVLALGAIVGLAALAASTTAGRAALRSLLTPRDP